MKQLLAGAALFVLSLAGAAGTVHAQGCAWMGNHWNCGDSYVYPKLYPHGTIVGDRTVILEPYKLPAAPAGHPTNDYPGPRPY